MRALERSCWLAPLHCPYAGRYDGALGVLVAIAAVAPLAERG